MKDDLEESKDIAEQATYEDESALAKRTVTIPLTEYDTIKREEHFIKSQTLIDIIDNIDSLLKEWRPQPRFTVTKIDDNTILNNYNSNPISLSPEFLKEIQSI